MQNAELDSKLSTHNLLKSTREITLNMLHSELSLGLTFSRIASTSNDPDKINRNRANARRAYDAVLKFQKRISLTKAEARDLRGGLVRIKRGLQQFGDYV